MGFKSTTFFLPLGMILNGCFQTPVETRGTVKVLDGSPRLVSSQQISASKTQASIDPNAKAAQTLLAPSSGSLSGSSITLEPGTLALAADLVVEEAASFSELSLVQDLSLDEDPGIKSVGSGLIIRPTEPVTLSGQLVINMPLPSETSLKLAGSSVVVFYRQYVGDQLLTGVIPTQDVILNGDGTCSFKGYFGAYWVALVAKPVEKAKSAPASEAIVNAQNVSVIQTSGVVSESTIAAKAQIPEVSWQTVGLSLDASTRSAILVASSSSSSLRDCRADFFESSSALSGSELTSGTATKAQLSIARKDAHKLVGRFRCFDAEGRRTVSPWSAALDIPAVSEPVTHQLPETAAIFAALALSGEASDGILNAGESGRMASTALWQLSASSYVAAAYTAPLADTTGTLVCDATQNYELSAIPGASRITSDGSYVICVQLKNAAGTSTYGKSAAVLRDATPPVISSFALANAASDAVINNSEMFLTNPLWILTASGASGFQYSGVYTNGSGFVCDDAISYSASAAATPAQLSSDGSFVSCVRATDAAGNKTFAKSQPVQRKTISLVALTVANEAGDQKINASEAPSTANLLNVSAVGQDAILYTAPFIDSGSISCDGSKSYSSSIPKINSLGADGSYAVCVKLSDSVGNVIYQKSPAIAKDTVAPLFTSLTWVAEAADGSINDSEKLGTAALWSLVASDYASAAYTLALDAQGGSLVCGTSQTYNQGSVPRATELTSDGEWTVCLKLSDSFGNVSYGKGETVIRDVTPPTAVSIFLSGDAVDGMINQSEMASTQEMWTVSGVSAGSVLTYTVPLSGSPSCSSSQSYSEMTIARASTLATDGSFVICVRVSDIAGNAVYVQSPSVLRDTQAPFLSVSLVNEAADTFINLSEQSSSSPLVIASLSDTGTLSYSGVLSSSSSCHAGHTYSGSVPAASSLGGDGTFIVCVRATDPAGNEAYLPSPSFTRDTSAPVITSIDLHPNLADGYLNAAEFSGSPFGLASAMASGFSDAAYALVPSATPCTNSLSYGAGPPPSNSASFGTDGEYRICLRLRDPAQNETISMSANFTLDRAAPSFTGIQELLSLNNGQDALVYWPAASDNFTPADKISYDVCWDTGANQCASSFAAQFSAAENLWSYRVSSLSAGTSYEFAVRARDEAGNRDNNTKILRNHKLANVIKVASGSEHSCALLSSGQVACWGKNSYGQLGDGTNINRLRPVPVSGISAATDVAVGGSHSCAILSDGSAKCWGYNGYGQLGDNSTISRNQAIAGVSGLTGIMSLALGENHSCAQLGSGDVKCWGYNDKGQVGDSTTITRLVPALVSSLSASASHLAAGARHTCAALVDNTVACWGDNASFQLGRSTPNFSSSPLAISGLSNVSQLALGMNQSCARLSDGTGKCWGYNMNGQLGNNATTQSAVPVNIQTGPGDATALSNIQELFAGYNHSCARLGTGDVKCWGWNGYGQIGLPAGELAKVPVPMAFLNTASAIALGQYHSCALIASDLKCWGSNNAGQLGNGSIDGLKPPVHISGLSSINELSLGDGHACALSAAGDVRCWGNNAFGQLGRNTNGPAPADAAPVWYAPGNSSPLSGVNKISLGHEHSCALISGSVKCWGQNQKGQLGNATNISQAAPVNVSGISGAIDLSVGGQHSCALLSTQVAHCWGDNTSGQLGTGNTTSVNAPQPVSTVSLTNIKQIAAGGFHSCAVDMSDDVWCWGSNVYGQLGFGDTAARNSPTKLTSLSGVASLSLGRFHSCAKLNNGNVSCWGSSYALTGSAHALVPTSISLTNADTLALGEDFTCAKISDADDSLACWGQADSYRSGLSSSTYTPTRLPLLRNVDKVAAGKAFGCVLLNDQTVRCWGDGRNGQGGPGKPFMGVADASVLGI